VLVLWFILSTFCYLLYKLFKEKPRNREKIHFYSPCVLPNSIVQEKNKQDKNQRRKIKKKSKAQLAIAGMELHRPYYFEDERSPWWECPAWRIKAVWSKWMMTWQKPTGKESSSRHGEIVLPDEKAIFCRRVKVHFPHFRHYLIFILERE